MDGLKREPDEWKKQDDQKKKKNLSGDTLIYVKKGNISPPSSHAPFKLVVNYRIYIPTWSWVMVFYLHSSQKDKAS